MGNLFQNVLKKMKKIKLTKHKLESKILDSGFTSVKHFICHFRRQGGFGMTSYYKFMKYGFEPIYAWGLCYYLDIELTEFIDYRANKNWQQYEIRFEALMDERKIPSVISQSDFLEYSSCLLCSEATPEQCHRRLVAERMAKYWGNVKIVHL